MRVLAAAITLLFVAPAFGTPDRSDERVRRARLVDHANTLERVIDRRVRQRAKKMKLTPAQARSIKGWVGAWLRGPAEPGSVVPAALELAAIMPHSAVELLRAHHERGLPAQEANRISRYLRWMVRAVGFDNLEQLDKNHSHVIGREWRQIDYRGETMTWRGQKAHWQPRGVESFNKAEYLHAYFKAASGMRYFKRIYRPKRSLRGLAMPKL